MESSESRRAGLCLRLHMDADNDAHLLSVFRSLPSVERSTLSGHARPGSEPWGMTWLSYETGLFEGLPIRLEVFGLVGNVGSVRRREARHLADAIVIMVDDNPAGRSQTRDHVASILSDLSEESESERGELVLLAPQTPSDEAISGDDVAKLIGLALDVPRVTSQSERGPLYALALAVRCAMKHLQRHDGEGKTRHAAWSPQQLMEVLDREQQINSSSDDVTAGDDPNSSQRWDPPEAAERIATPRRSRKPQPTESSRSNPQLAPLLALAIERQGQGVVLGERRDLLGIERGYQTIRQQPTRPTDQPTIADSADELAGGQRRGALSRLISALLK